VLAADLWAVVASVVLVAAVVFSPAGTVRPLAIAVGLPFVLVVPGYALVSAVFPRAGETASLSSGTSWLARLGLSVVGSVVAVALVGGVLDFTVWGFQRTPVVAGLCLFTLAHSLVAAVPLSVAVLAVAWYRGHSQVGFAFGLGYASHLLGDTYVALYHWRVGEFTFLLWPILPAYPYDDFGGFVDFAAQLELTRGLLLAGLVSAAVGALFLAHFARAPWLPAPRSN